MRNLQSRNNRFLSLKIFLKCLVAYFFFGQTSILAQDSIQKVKAIDGDGIYSLLRRHGFTPTDFYKKFVELNKESLDSTNQLFAGRLYNIPDSTFIKEQSEIESIEVERYPIFGEAYAAVERSSEKLKNTIYYLISGHGGPDPGAIETYEGKTIAEDEYAYDITLRLARELLSHGAEVYIIVRDENDGIRDERILDVDHDEVVYPNKTIPLNQVKRLKQRTDVVNQLYKKHRGRYQRLIVTHVDGRTKGTNIDVFFYHHHKSKNGKRLTESIHETFKKKYKKFQPNRKYTGTFRDRSSLYLVKNTLPAIAYIEIGNIRSKKDQRRFLDPDNRQALAKWVSEGILLDFETRPNQ